MAASNYCFRMSHSSFRKSLCLFLNTSRRSLRSETIYLTDGCKCMSIRIVLPKSGLRRLCGLVLRKGNLREGLLVSQGGHGIDAHSAARRNIARPHGHAVNKTDENALRILADEFAAAILFLAIHAAARGAINCAVHEWETVRQRQWKIDTVGIRRTWLESTTSSCAGFPNMIQDNWGTPTPT